MQINKGPLHIVNVQNWTIEWINKKINACFCSLDKASKDNASSHSQSSDIIIISTSQLLIKAEHISLAFLQQYVFERKYFLMDL